MIVFIVHVFLLGVLVDKWSSQAQEHIGCFHWTSIHPILRKTAFIPNHDENIMTIELCIERCKTMFPTTYAGINDGFRCRCGDRLEHMVDEPQLNDSSCTSTCAGDQRSKCGGANSIVIYSVCNQNRYRNITGAKGNCDASCHCMELQACTYSTGLCPASCEPGRSSEACNIRNVTFVTGDRTLMTDAVTHSEGTGVTVHPTTTLVLQLGTDPADRIEPITNDNIPVTAIAVGVSVAFVCLVAIAAFIVYFRKRGHTRKSDDSPMDAASISEVTVGHIYNKDDLAMEQPDNGQLSSSSPGLNYSPVVFADHSPAHDDGKDIAKSDDDIVIHDDQEKVEYAVSMRPTVTQHANLKENSLYGAYSEDMDDNILE